MTPCHAQKYREALEGMRQLASQMWQGGLPPWGQAAMQQHAHYYAAQACGEDTMRFSNYQARAALGITRSGTSDGRTITLEGLGRFGVIGAGDNPGVAYHESNVTAGKECPKDNSGTTGAWSAYCACMYGEGDRTGTSPAGKGGSHDFADYSPRWACQKAAEFNLKPWNCEGVILTLLASGGKADPLRHLSGSLTSGPKGAEYRRCAEKVVDTLEQFYDGARPAMQALGILPGASMPAASTGANPIADVEAYKYRLTRMTDWELNALPRDEYVVTEINWRFDNSCGQKRARLGTTFAADGRPACVTAATGAVFMQRESYNKPIKYPGAMGGDSKSAIPTGLILGGAAAAVAALFLLKK